jgi:thioredoxin-related protein
LAIKYDVTTIPRVLLFKGSDKPIQQIVGLTPETELVKLLDKTLA